MAVYDTDYDATDEYVVSTTANGEEVHGKCSPKDGAVLDGRGFFECVRYMPLPVSPDSTYTFVTTATPSVDEHAYEGSFVYVEYMVDCEGTCQPPSAPPMPPPPSPPPPLPPTCEYSATPAGSGNGTNATGSFTDPNAPMPLPPPAPPSPPVPAPPVLSPRQLGRLHHLHLGRKQPQHLH